MFQRYFIWRAGKRSGRSHYRIDRRHYKGVFKPGFFAHLTQTNFWQTDNDPFLRARRRRKRIFLVIGLILILGLIWMVVESTQALKVF